jgi:hypothetical protein
MSVSGSKEGYEGTNYELKTLDVLISAPCSREELP